MDRDNKHVVYVWTTKVNNFVCNNKHNFWGIGDVIRGMLSTGELCEQHGYQYSIDISLHPIKKWLRYNRQTVDKHITPKNISFIPCSLTDDEKLEEYVSSQTNQTITLMTNSFIKNEEALSHNVKKAVQEVFVLKPEYEEKLHDVREMIQLHDEYTVIHFRLGDAHLGVGPDTRPQTDMFHEIIKILKEYDPSHVLVMSDSQTLKNHVAKNLPQYKMYQTKGIAHIGVVDHSVHMLDTLIEYNLAAKSESIHSYTMYDHHSGFVNSCSLLYDVNITNNILNIST